MTEVRRRRVATPAEGTTRRRDRAAAEPEEDDETTAAAPEPEPDDDDDDEVDTTKRSRRSRAAEPDDDDDEPEEKPKRRSTRAAEPDDDDDEPEPPKKRRSTRAADPEPDDDDDDDAPAPSRRRKSITKGKLPPGVAVGRAGVEKLRKERGDGAMRLQLGSEPELIKFLEPEPFATFAQHWVSQGGQSGNRPYTCPGKEECPLCDLGDRANQVVWYNVLHLSADEKPKNMILPLGVKADKALVDAATLKKTGKADIERNYFAASKSGKQQQSQTNFRPIKLDDIEEDWEELLDNFDLDELPDLIEEARDHLFDLSLVQITPPKQLREVAAYLAED